MPNKCGSGQGSNAGESQEVLKDEGGGDLSPWTPGFYYNQILMHQNNPLAGKSAIGREIINGVFLNTGHHDPLELLNATQLARLKAGLNPLTGEKLKGVKDLVDSITKIHESVESQSQWYSNSKVAYSISDLTGISNSGGLDKMKELAKVAKEAAERAGKAVVKEIMAEETPKEKEVRLKKEKELAQLATNLNSVKGKYDSPYDDKSYHKDKYDYKMLGTEKGRVRLRDGTFVDYTPSMYENKNGAVILITGSRSYTNVKEAKEALESMARNTIGGIRYVVEGGAKGADTILARAALELGIPVKEYALDNWHWKRTKDAGTERNSSMLWDNIDPSYTTKALSFFANNNVSPGTSDMTKKLILAGIQGEIKGLSAEKALTWSASWVGKENESVKTQGVEPKYDDEREDDVDEDFIVR